MTKKKNKNKPAAMPHMETLIQALTKASISPRKPRNRRRRPKKTAVDQEGMITLRRSELVASLTTDDKGKVNSSLLLAPKSFKFLAGIAKSFERSRWLKMHVFYRPAVSVTKGGLVALGVDWDGASEIATLTREQISTFTPSQHFAVWKDTAANPMILPPSKLQSRIWYQHNTSVDVDAAPARLRVCVEATEVKSQLIGELWVAYEIQMQGTGPG